MPRKENSGKKKNRGSKKLEPSNRRTRNIPEPIQEEESSPDEKRKLYIASLLLYTVAFIAVGVGFYYSLSSTITPYHEKFLGRSHSDLPARVSQLMLDLMGVAGGGFLSIGVTLAYLVKEPFQSRAHWTWQCIFLLMFISLPIMLMRTLNVGFYTPWFLPLIMMVMVIVAYILTKEQF